MITAKVTSKSQTTIPKKIREKLNIHSNDTIVFEIEDDHAIMRKVNVVDTGYLKALKSTLEEWNSEEDSRLTMTFKPWDVVVVPFPFVDKKVSKLRPALVLSDIDFNIIRSGHSNHDYHSGKKHLITFDMVIRNLVTTGLPLPSVVRWKIFSLDPPLIKKKIGYLSKTDREECNKILQTIFSN